MADWFKGLKDDQMDAIEEFAVKTFGEAPQTSEDVMFITSEMLSEMHETAKSLTKMSRNMHPRSAEESRITEMLRELEEAVHGAQEKIDEFYF